MKAVCIDFSNMALTNLQSLKAENSIKGINRFQYTESDTPDMWNIWRSRRVMSRRKTAQLISLSGTKENSNIILLTF